MKCPEEPVFDKVTPEEDEGGSQEDGQRQRSKERGRGEAQQAGLWNSQQTLWVFSRTWGLCKSLLCPNEWEAGQTEKSTTVPGSLGSIGEVRTQGQPLSQDCTNRLEPGKCPSFPEQRPVWGLGNLNRGSYFAGGSVQTRLRLKTLGEPGHTVRYSRNIVRFTSSSSTRFPQQMSGKKPSAGRKKDHFEIPQRTNSVSKASSPEQLPPLLRYY